MRRRNTPTKATGSRRTSSALLLLCEPIWQPSFALAFGVFVIVGIGVFVFVAVGGEVLVGGGVLVAVGAGGVLVLVGVAVLSTTETVPDALSRFTLVPSILA